MNHTGPRIPEAPSRSEQRYELAVQGANDGLWDWDLTSDRIYYAPQWKSMLGHQGSEIGDSPEEWVRRVHPLDRERVRAELAAHRLGQTARLQVDYRMLRADFTYCWMLARGLASRDAEGEVVRIVGLQTDITELKAGGEPLLPDAFHDPLTGLPNRALLIDRLSQSILRMTRHAEHRFAVLFLDLDGFKIINDSLGHQIGDQLLIAISQRLKLCVRCGDTVARLGGDEFIILTEHLEDPDHMVQLADRVLAELQVPFFLNGHQLVSTASAGLVLSCPRYDQAEELLRDAEIAMYQAKARRKAGYVIFDKMMHTLAVSRLKLESDLRHAAVRQEFRLHYQPIVSLGTGQIVGLEALLRWYHPQRGLILPDEFIPLAEETRLILPIGLWVLREAVKELRRWQSESGSNAPLSISVNLSCRQFLQPDLVEQVERILVETGLPARCLRMEVTESVIMEQLETALATLARLKALGVQLAMDDFGKGYSSLSYLNQFPFDTLKIDRSFIARMGVGGENSEIVRTIISLANRLGLEVVAEGVETESQLTLLRELGCHFGQGFLLSRPLSSEAASTLLAQPPRFFGCGGHGSPALSDRDHGSRKAKPGWRTTVMRGSRKLPLAHVVGPILNLRQLVGLGVGPSADPRRPVDHSRGGVRPRAAVPG